MPAEVSCVAYQVHFGHKDARDQHQYPPIREEIDETPDFLHDIGIFEDGNMCSIVSHHLLRIDDEKECDQNSHAHDDDAEHWASVTSCVRSIDLTYKTEYTAFETPVDSVWWKLTPKAIKLPTVPPKLVKTHCQVMNSAFSSSWAYAN